MKNLKVSINDFDYEKLGFTNESVAFDELREKINIEYAREALIKCNQIARQTGLSQMTLDEINEEINAVRCKK